MQGLLRTPGALLCCTQMSVLSGGRHRAICLLFPQTFWPPSRSLSSLHLYSTSSSRPFLRLFLLSRRSFSIIFPSQPRNSRPRSSRMSPPPSASFCPLCVLASSFVVASVRCGHWLALRTGDIMLWPLAPSHGILHEISPGASWLAVGAVASSSLHYFSAAACLHTELHLLKRNCKNMRKSRIVGLCICWWIQESAGGHFPKQSSKIAFYNARDRKWQTDIEKWNCIESKCIIIII